MVISDLKQYIYYLIIGTILSSCMGTRYLEANETLIVKKAKINGVKGVFNEDIEAIMTQKPNKKFMGILPFVHLAHGYQIGKRKFDPQSYQSKIDKVNLRYERKIAKAKSVASGRSACAKDLT